MLVEEPLPGSPPRPVPAGHSRDMFGCCTISIKAHELRFVYRDMIDRQSGQGDEKTKPAPRTTTHPVSLCRAPRNTHNQVSCGHFWNSTTGQLPFWKSDPPETTCHVSNVELKDRVHTYYLNGPRAQMGFCRNIWPEPTALPFAIGPVGSLAPGLHSVNANLLLGRREKTTRLDLSETW